MPAAIPANRRYTGRRAWNRQRTDSDLIDPANTGLGNRPVQAVEAARRMVISARPRAIVSEAGYIRCPDASAPRGPAGPAAPLGGFPTRLLVAFQREPRPHGAHEPLRSPGRSRPSR
jgi:hypothetical protein